MKIDISKVAKLANLDLSDEEKKEFDQQLSSIVDYIEKLEKIDTKDVELTTQVTGLSNVFQENTTPDSLTQNEATSGNKKTHNGLFVVEKLVDTN